MLVTDGLAQNLVVVCYFADIGHRNTPLRHSRQRGDAYIYSKPQLVALPLQLTNVICDDIPALIGTLFKPLMQHPSGDCSDQHCSLFYAPQRSLNMRFLKPRHISGSPAAPDTSTQTKKLLPGA